MEPHPCPSPRRFSSPVPPAVSVAWAARSSLSSVSAIGRSARSSVPMMNAPNRFERPVPTLSSAISRAPQTSRGAGGLSANVLWDERLRALSGRDRDRGRRAREQGNLEVFVNISQLTVSQMSLTNMTDSPQQRQHWLGEQVLNWSGLPVVHVRPTVFLQHPFFSEWAAESIARDDTIRLPFGNARTSPVDTRDVAEIIAAILVNPGSHVGRIYELTGPRSEDMPAVAAEYSAALGRSVTYVDEPLDQWRDRELRARNLPEHLFGHLLTMARLHAANRYDRLTHDVEAVVARPATSIRDYVATHPELFRPTRTISSGYHEESLPVEG